MIYQLFWKMMAPAGALSALVYLVFDKWHSWFLGALALILYFLFVSAKTQGMLVRYFGFVKTLRVRLLAIFLSLATLGWFLGIFIFFDYFNGLTVFLSFLVNALVWSLANQSFSPLLGERQREGYSVYEENRTNTPPLAPPLKGEGDLESPRPKIIVLVYLGLVIYGFYLLIQSKTGGVISSPWQTINPNYVWVFLSATFLLGALIFFSKISVKTLLFFLIVHAFLLHSYLPLTHELFYGADGWRHVANEERLVDGRNFKEAVLGGANQGSNFQFLISNFQIKSKIQNLKTKAGLLSYANFWGTNAVLAKILQIDLISLTKWFLPISWSIIFTILLYEIGLALGWSGKNSLFLAWAGMLPFALQAGGSFSLPVNFGFLIFVLFFLLLLKRAKEPNTGQRNILLALGVGSVFGYLLFFVLCWLSLGVLAVIKLKVKKFIKVKTFILLLIATLFIPAIELVGDYSQFDKSINILAQAKQFVGNIFAVYLANGPRPHDITGGNILFNQMQSAIFTPNFLTQWLWWLPAVVVVAVVLIILGIKRNRKDPIYKFILTIFAVLLTSYFLSFYLLAGERLFFRRLDATLALLFLILVFYGFDKTVKNPTPRPSPCRGGNEEESCVLSPSPTRGGIKGGVLSVAVISLAITASYTLGPDTYAVSSNQYDAAGYVWSQEQNNIKHCVLGDTYSLLALEAVSAKEIIGGGFPIDANFSQPERVDLIKQMNLAINNSLLTRTVELTGANHCWFMGNAEVFRRQGVLQGSAYKIFGDTAVIKYDNLK